MTFSFNLYAIFLQVALVIYFGSETEGLGVERPLEDGEVCCH